MRYWIQWPDGATTGLITDSLRFAQRYAREHGGTVRPETDPQPAVPTVEAGEWSTEEITP